MPAPSSNRALVAAARVLVICPLLALIAWRAGVSAGRRQVDTALDVSVRSKLSQWLGTALMITAGCAAFALVDSLGMALYLWLHDNGGRWPLKGGGLMAAVASLIALVGRLAPLLGESQGGRHLSLPKNLLAGGAAAIVFGWIFISLSAFVHFVAWQGKSPDDRALMSVAALAWLTGLTGLLTVLCGSTIRFVNSSSHQALYGNRLTRAYLGASNKKRFTSEGGQRLSDPIQGDNIGWGEYAPHEVGGPLHLVNVTLNETVLGASQVEQRDRKGLPMAVGPCGLSAGLESHALWKQHGDSAGSAQTAAWEGRLPGPSTDWVKPLPREGHGFHLFATPTLEPHRVEALSVGTWTAISGAAFSTGLGARTSLAASLLLGIANVRLGYWWNSHIKPEQREGVRTAPTLRNRMGEQLNAWFPVQVHLIQEFTARFFGPNRERWYLTDGGHFENTACYELLRRRVPFIIASDNGQDASYTFEDLANLVRKARIDLCADIRFLSRSDIETIVEPSLHGAIGVLDDFRTAEDGQLAAGLARGFARAHALLAHVYYEGAEEPESVMLFIKPTLTGDEPLDVLQYRQQHRAFPQEPTSDQFFDEAQWESYRALGEHIGAELFRPIEAARGWSPSAHDPAVSRCPAARLSPRPWLSGGAAAFSPDRRRAGRPDPAALSGPARAGSAGCCTTRGVRRPASRTRHKSAPAGPVWDGRRTTSGETTWAPPLTDAVSVDGSRDAEVYGILGFPKLRGFGGRGFGRCVFQAFRSGGSRAYSAAGRFNAAVSSDTLHKVRRF